MARLFLLLAAVFAVTFAFENIKFKDCKSKFKVTRVEVAGDRVIEENGKQIAMFKPGSQATIRVHFTPDEDGAEGFETTVKAKIKDSMLSWNMPEPKTCNFMSCPTKTGTPNVYEQKIDIRESYPQDVNIQINWNINRKANENTRDICVVFLGKIQN